MASYGYRGDVSNSIGAAAAYPNSRTYAFAPPSSARYPMRNNSMGELGAVNMGPVGMVKSGAAAPQDHAGVVGKPVGWWLTIVIALFVIIWLMRRFAPAEAREFGNIRPGLYNGFFLAAYLVIILSVLKVAGGKMQSIPILRKFGDLLLAI